MIEYIIDEEYESVRVDRFLRKHLKKYFSTLKCQLKNRKSI